MTAEIRRILVIATRQIGDVLLTTPLIAAARARWPSAQLDVLGFKGTLGMLRGNPDLDHLLEVVPGSGWRASWALVRRLWRRYDLALITQHSDRAALYGWVAARQRAGLVALGHSSTGWKQRALVHAVPIADDRGERHTVVEKLELLAPWRVGANAAAPNTPVRVQAPAGTPLPAALAARLEAAPVVVHVPSMWRYKQWPVAHYRVLVAGLLADGHQVVLSGGPAARDREMVATLHDLAPSPRLLDVAGQLDFNQLATLLMRASLYIGPDTSVTHLAAALDIPVLTLFGPTNPKRWGPWPQGVPATEPYVRRAETQRVGRVILLQGPGSCVPCGRAGCEDHHDSRSDCLEQLLPERVLAQARVLLLSP